ncbi:hypothetical protein A4D02_18775 [Niastella koreensis]|uniref:Uncharacterized protein n=2 Tax=Niastella koreensis TaxID=354356 RepID=G8T803_NIAKG|nr:hypothetical protein [Niastella koreensis]AEV96941.1 hypothetical protein Niako_0546 [Niastella koreensis GR20-10]OQP39362.1 hypothetical protein A4D02_18775 [Niastella koreensis]
MQTFKINTKGFTKKFLKRSIPTVLLPIIIWITIFNIQGGGAYVSITFYLIPIVFITALCGFSIWRGIKRQRALLESYELTISDTLICREQLNTPDISILVSEVIEIAKHPKGGFTIKGSRKNGTIIIPVQIENYEQIEAILQQIHPIILKKNAWKNMLRVLLPLAGLGLFLCVYLLNNKIIVGVAGTLLTGLMIWSLVLIQKNKNVDRKTKNRMWIMLLVLASIIWVTIMKLTAPTLP